MFASHIGLDVINQVVFVGSALASFALAAMTIAIINAVTGNKRVWRYYLVAVLVWFAVLCYVNFVILGPQK
jgi:hypothetical protein